MAFVVTKNDVVIFVERSGPCSSCYNSGKDATHIPLKHIQTVVANNTETGCLACCSVPAIDLKLSTMHSTGGKVCILCYNPCWPFPTPGSCMCTPNGLLQSFVSCQSFRPTHHCPVGLFLQRPQMVNANFAKVLI